MSRDLPVLSRALPLLRVRLVTPLTVEDLYQQLGDALVVPGMPPFQFRWDANTFQAVAGGLQLRGEISDEGGYRTVTVWLFPVPPFAFAALALVMGGLIVISVSEQAGRFVVLGGLLVLYGMALLAFQSRARVVDAHLRRVITHQGE